MSKDLIKRLRHIYADGDPITEEAADCIEKLFGITEQLEAENAALKSENEILKERQDFAPDQWWIKELGGIDSCCRNLTHDEYRAVRIAVTAINVLFSENAELRKDAERLDWLLECHDATVCSGGPHGPYHVWFRYSNRVTGEYADKRAAIDAAKGVSPDVTLDDLKGGAV